MDEARERFSKEWSEIQTEYKAGMEPNFTELMEAGVSEDSVVELREMLDRLREMRQESLSIPRSRFFAAVEACRHREADASNDQRDDMTFIMDEMQIPKDLLEDLKEVISNEINHALDLTDGLPDRERDEYLWKEAFEDAWGAISEALETRERKRLKKTI